jgi:hypothetical protein
VEDVCASPGSDHLLVDALRYEELNYGFYQRACAGYRRPAQIGSPSHPSSFLKFY